MTRKKLTSLSVAIGKAAEKPLVNPRLAGKNRATGPAAASADRSAGVSPVPAPAEAPAASAADSAAPVSKTPQYRIDKQAIAAYLPQGYRQRIRVYQARFDNPVSLADVLVEALDDLFIKHGLA